MRIKLLIYLLAALSLLTVNIYLPATSTLQTFFLTTKSNISLSISFYMLGLAIGIPVYGALADHIKATKVLIFGLVLYIISNFLAIFSPNIDVFLIARLLEGLSAASALCLWQVFAYIYFEKDASSMINSGFIVIGSMPALAPLIGGFLLSMTSWYGIFIFLIILAIVILLITCSILKTPLAKHNKHIESQTHIILTILHQYSKLLLDPIFIILTLASSSIYISVYIYLSQIPFLLASIGYGTKNLSTFFIPISIGFIIGGIISKRLIKIGVKFLSLFYLAVYIFTISLIIVLITMLLKIQISGLLLMGPFFLFTIGAGIAMPNLVSQAINLHPHRRGTAASAIGLTQNLAAFLFTSLGAYLTKYGYTGLIITYFIIVFLPFFWLLLYSFYKKE